MDTVPEDSRRRRRVAGDVLSALREVNGQFIMLNHQVGARASLRPVDLSCLDQIARYGPIGPGALAKRVGMHPATMTGILDRLERSGWIARERDPDDRRAVVVRTLPDRGAELYRLYTGMRTAMDEICAGYDVEQLELIIGFLTRVADAGERSAQDLADQA